MAKLDASEVVGLLSEYGRRTALRGGNPYRSKAYVRAAENLAALAEPLNRLVDEGRLQEIPGVGEAIAEPDGSWKVTYPEQIPTGTFVAATQTGKGATSELAMATSTADPVPPEPPPLGCKPSRYRVRDGRRTPL